MQNAEFRDYNNTEQTVVHGGNKRGIIDMESIVVSTLENLCQQCKGHQVKIYGAKTIAQRACVFLESRNIEVSAFVVSQRYENPQTLLEKPVVRIEKAGCDYDCMVVAVGSSLVESVEKELQNYKIKKLVIVDTRIQDDFPGMCILSCTSHISEHVCIEDEVQIVSDDTSTIIIDGGVVVKTGTQIIAADNSYIHIKKGTYIQGQCKLYAEENSKIFFSENMYMESGNDILCRENSEINISECVWVQYGGYIGATKSKISIGKKTTFGTNLKMLAAGSEINIGEDNMYSHFVKVFIGAHSIKERICGKDITNRRPIKTGNHVWVGVGATLFPGCDVGDGSVIGGASFVNKTIPAHSTCAGNPARVLRENIDWER